MKTIKLIALCILIHASTLIHSAAAPTPHQVRELTKRALELFSTTRQAAPQTPAAKRADQAPLAAKKAVQTPPAAKTRPQSPKQTIATVEPSDQCLICKEDASTMPSDQILKTNCCQNFICKQCVQELEKQALKNYSNYHNPAWREREAALPDFPGWPPKEDQERTQPKCPACRHSPLETNKAIIAVPVAQREDERNPDPRPKTPQKNQRNQPAHAKKMAPDHTKTTCEFCAENKKANDCVTLNCGHTYCKDCLEYMLKSAIKKRNIGELFCLHAGCNHRFTQEEVKLITEDEELRNWILALALNAELNREEQALTAKLQRR